MIKVNILINSHSAHNQRNMQTRVLFICKSKIPHDTTTSKSEIINKFMCVSYVRHKFTFPSFSYRLLFCSFIFTSNKNEVEIHERQKTIQG